MTENNKQEKYYSDLDPKPNFAQLELDILEFWEEKKIFNKSVTIDLKKMNMYFMMALHLLMDCLTMDIY